MPLYVELPRVDRKVGKLRLYCIRISDRLLILGNGGVTVANKYEDDPFLLSCVNKLRCIENKLRQEVKKAGTDYDNFDAAKQVIETINI